MRLVEHGRLVLPTGKDKLICHGGLGRLSKQRPTNLGFRCQEPQVMQVAQESQSSTAGALK